MVDQLRFSYSKGPTFPASAEISAFFLKEDFPAFFPPLKYVLAVHSTNLALIKTVHIVQP